MSKSAHSVTQGPWMQDFLASLVVFLVALPLCLGIAIASGLPPAAGLISGVIGGLVIGSLGGCRLQVSGPAAGLITIVWDLLQRHGAEGLGVVVLLAGAIQLAFGLAKLGHWFRAVSPAVIKGMLSGIGVVIFASQFHVMIDDAPRAGGLANLASIPEAVWKAFSFAQGPAHFHAAMIGLLTILTIMAWSWRAPRRLKAVPPTLMGVLAAVTAANVLGLPINYISVPENLLSILSLPSPGAAGSLLISPAILVSALTVAFVASAETLLTATAVDQMQHHAPRTDYNREIAAQGVGNMLAGLAGALPITGVIVRSAANVQAGGRTRASTVMHGAWLLLFVALLPGLLAYIPVSSLAAILVYTGIKLMNPAAVRQLAKFGRGEVAVYGVTVAVIVATDLLTGIVAGLALAAVKALYRLSHLEIRREGASGDGPVTIHLGGAANFLNLPRVAAAFESIPPGREVHVRCDDLIYIDHACMELLAGWRDQYGKTGGRVELYESRPLPRPGSGVWKAWMSDLNAAPG